MIGLLMAGGHASRMGDEKLALRIGGVPMVTRVIDAMIDSALYERIVVATSPNSPRARDIVRGDARVTETHTAGAGFSEDLQEAVSNLDGDVMIVPGDLGRIDGDALRSAHALRRKSDAWTVIVITDAFAKSVSDSVEFFVDVDGTKCCYTGVSIVNASLVRNSHVREDVRILDDTRIALNVNTPRDYSLLSGSFGGP